MFTATFNFFLLGLSYTNDYVIHLIMPMHASRGSVKYVLIIAIFNVWCAEYPIKHRVHSVRISMASYPLVQNGMRLGYVTADQFVHSGVQNILKQQIVEVRPVPG
ncbi:unnamed protein product [Echinostoma caproni]|uniref:Secreted protein n=1 Tax=Echinostoma caproni TaxID=27848 RepID=A0A183B2Y3_9TREM|nr:unnamed protein product [Echinostoma caproni]